MADGAIEALHVSRLDEGSRTRRHRQQIGGARLIANPGCYPTCVILGLAPLVIRQIFEIIRKINRESNTTIFLVEQNANLALQIAHRGYVIENGRIVFSGKAEELLKNTDIQKAYLGI